MTKLHIAPEGAKRSAHADEMLREKMAPWIDHHIRCDVSGLVKAIQVTAGYHPPHLPPGPGITELFHTDITIATMRACVADAGYTVKQNRSALGAWQGTLGYWFKSEQEALQDIIDCECLDPAQYARDLSPEALAKGEPKQWLVVSDELAPKLREQGETVREFAGLNIWLRCDDDELAGDPVLRAIWEAVR